MILVKALPSTGEDHWTYTIPRQGHGKASDDYWIKIKKARVKSNGAQSSRSDYNCLEPFENRLYSKRSIMTTKLKHQFKVNRR